MLLLHAYAARSTLCLCHESTAGHHPRRSKGGKLRAASEGTWLCLAQAILGIARANAPGSSRTAELLLQDMSLLPTCFPFPWALALFLCWLGQRWFQAQGMSLGQ